MSADPNRSTSIDHRSIDRCVRSAASRIAACRSLRSFVDDLRGALGDEFVITEPEQLATYDCDGLTGWRAQPACVVLPGSTEEVQAVLRLCARDGVPFVARGAGTGLSGGALPVADGIVVSVARMNRILEVDVESERVVVQPGVTNLDVTRAVADDGYFYAPDPSSQQVCTIGGNVAENSGGAHCLKHGFTVNHVTGAKVVLPDGELLELGGKSIDADDGPDLLGVIVGSEGTLGIAVEVTLRIVRQPEVVVTQLAAFASVDAAGDAVSRDRRRGDPAGGDGDHGPLHDPGRRGGVPPRLPRGRRRCAARRARRRRGAGRGGHRGRRRRSAATPGRSRSGRRATRPSAPLLWRGRKGAFAAMGRVSPDYYVQDGVVPRTKLPAVLRRIDELSEEHGLRVGNVFHAGDGNLHPLVLYDAAAEGEYERAKALADAILAACVDAGGSLTGEHGIGVDKACAMPSMFSERDLEVFERVRRAFDPDGLANPGKVLPTPRLCGEVPGPYRAAPARAARARGALLMLGPTSIEEAAALLADGERGAATRPDRRGPLDRRARPRARARGRRPHVHGRGGDPALRAAGRASAGRPAALARPARATRRSARASRGGSPARSRTASARRATSCSA